MSTSVSQSLPINGAMLTDNDVSLKALFDVIFEADLSTGTFNQTRFKTIPGLILGGSVLSDSKLTVTWGINISGHPANQSAMDLVFTNATGKTTNIIDTVISWGLSVNLKPSYLPADNYVFKAEGYIFCPEDGNYTFALDSDDCSDLIIDGALKVNRYNSNGMGVSNNWNSSAVVTLTAGWHTICVRMEEISGGDGLGFAWKKPGDSSFTLVDPSYFSSVLPVYYSSGDRIAVKSLSGTSDNMVLSWSSKSGSTGTIAVYYAITTDGVNPPTEWSQATSGNQISADGVDMTGKYLWTKIVLNTSNTSITPIVMSLLINVSNPQTGNITFEIDRVSTFTSPSKQISTISNIARKTIAEFPIANIIGGDWYWRCIASSGGISSGYSNTRLLNVNAEIYKRVSYQYENIGKLKVWTKKRVLYQYENISKLDVWTKKRSLYQYENITLDPPKPFIDRLSSTRGPTGSMVTIYGNGFGYSPVSDIDNTDRFLRSYGGFVYIGDLLCSIQSWSWQEIVVQLPEEALSGPIKVELTIPSIRDSNLKGFEVYDGLPTEDIGIELFICDRYNPNTILCQLDGAYNKSFQVLQNGPGSGSFKISKQDSKGGNKDFIAEQNFVLVKLDGNPIFKWIIENITPIDVDSSEKKEISVSGRGILSILNRAVVYPSNMGAPVLDREFSGTASAILRTLLIEAQNRGGLQGISINWADDYDSLGNPFSDETVVKFHVGTPLLEVVTKFSEGLGLFDIELTPELNLKLYKTKGEDLSSAVIYRPGQAIVSHQTQNDATQVVNEVIVEGANGVLAIASESTSQATYGRREGYLSANNVEAGLSEYGQAYMNRAAFPKWGIQGEIVDFIDSNGNKMKPFETYLLGDWIGWNIPPEGSDVDGFSETLRLKGVTVNEDDTGHISYTLELNSVILEHDIKLNQLVGRISQYTGSDILSTAPGSPEATISKGQIEEKLTGDIQTHNHDTFYYTKIAIGLLLAAKAESNHNHDLLYSALNHDHDSIYSLIEHNHDLVYASLTHAHNFLGLTDTPDEYLAGKYLKVNSGGNAIEFVDAPSGGGSGTDYIQTNSDGGTPSSTYDDTNVESNALIPVGGIEGQILVKVSDSDRDVEWTTPASGGGYPISADIWHTDSIATSGTSIVTVAGGTIWGNYGLQNPAASTDKFTCKKFVLAAGTYTFRVDGYIDSNRGMLDFYLDDVKIVSQQNWASGGSRKDTTAIVVSTSGEHILRGEINGGSPYYMCLSRFAFIKE